MTQYFFLIPKRSKNLNIKNNIIDNAINLRMDSPKKVTTVLPVTRKPSAMIHTNKGVVHAVGPVFESKGLPKPSPFTRDSAIFPYSPAK
jgi:hypothetical protein